MLDSQGQLLFNDALSYQRWLTLPSSFLQVGTGTTSQLIICSDLRIMEQNLLLSTAFNCFVTHAKIPYDKQVQKVKKIH